MSLYNSAVRTKLRACVRVFRYFHFQQTPARTQEEKGNFYGFHHKFDNFISVLGELLVF